MTQISFFDGEEKLRITKPIRLIELFAGYGSQSLALKYLGVPFEHHKICEWAIPSIQAYKDLHATDDTTDYSQGMTAEEVFEHLAKQGVSSNYNEPMTYDQIKRMGDEKARTIYNNIKATNNLVSVCNAHGKDFEITDRDKYCYVLTYSFPCQDLSKAGKGKGMAKDSGTRSGLLWEVERILDELNADGGNIPHILLMENVPDVIGTKNIKHFADWVKKLDSLGYTSKWQCMNAKNYGVPQNRDRCFMVSWLGNYYYDFPQEKKLTRRLKDVLETDVDEKYYLSSRTLNYFIEHSKECEQKGNGFRFTPTDGGGCARAVTTLAGNRMDDNFIKETQIVTEGFYHESRHSASRVVGTQGIAPTVMENHGTITAIKECVVEEQVNRIGGLYDTANQKHQAGSIYDKEGLAPTLDTASGGHRQPLILDGFNNKALNETLKANDIDDGDFIDAYNRTIRKDIAGTITTRVSDSNQTFVADGKTMNFKPSDVCGTLLTNSNFTGAGVQLIKEEMQHEPIEKQTYRIRKLTPKECGRLMGVKDNDIDKMSVNQSNSKLYHLYGDSIVVDVLMKIFGEMI